MARFYETVLGLWDKLGRRARLAGVSAFVIVLVGSALAGYRQWSYMT